MGLDKRNDLIRTHLFEPLRAVEERKVKKVLLVVVAVVLALVLGAKIDAPGAIVLGEDADKAMANELVGYIWEGEGPSQVLKRAGCNIRWTAWSMERSDISIEMLPNLRIGKEVFYPENCTEVPPTDVAANSERIFKSERARLKVVHTPRTSEPPEEFAALVARNAELEKQVAEFTERLAAAEAAGGASPISSPNTSLSPKTQDVLVAGLREELKKANAGWEGAEIALEEKIRELDEEKSLSKSKNLGFMLLVTFVIMAMACALLFRRKSRRPPEEVPAREKTGDAAVAAVSASPPPIGVFAKPSGRNDNEKDGVFTERGDYLIRFDGEAITAKVARSYRVGKNTSLIVEVYCPNEKCPVVGIHTDNFKSHLAKCPYGKHRGLRPVSASAVS